MKKINEEGEITEATPIENQEETGTTDNTSENDTAAESSEEDDQNSSSKGKKGRKDKNVQSDDIDSHADKILKSFANYEELYIDSKGGVYENDQQLNIPDNAILYKNKYFKK